MKISRSLKEYFVDIEVVILPLNQSAAIVIILTCLYDT